MFHLLNRFECWYVIAIKINGKKLLRYHRYEQYLFCVQKYFLQVEKIIDHILFQYIEKLILSRKPYIIKIIIRTKQNHGGFYK